MNPVTVDMEMDGLLGRVGGEHRPFALLYNIDDTFIHTHTQTLPNTNILIA